MGVLLPPVLSESGPRAVVGFPQILHRRVHTGLHILPALGAFLLERFKVLSGRVLHTQVLEVIDSAVPRRTLKICWAFAPVGFDPAPGTMFFNELALLLNLVRRLQFSFGCV